MEDDQLTYKGYIGNIQQDVDGIFHGKVLNIDDHITYEGWDKEGLKKDFEESVDEYEKFCKEMGITPKFTEVQS